MTCDDGTPLNTVTRDDVLAYLNAFERAVGEREDEYIRSLERDGIRTTAAAMRVGMVTLPEFRNARAAIGAMREVMADGPASVEVAERKEVTRDR